MTHEAPPENEFERTADFLLGEVHRITDSESRVNNGLAELGPDGRADLTRTLAQHFAGLPLGDPERVYVTSLLSKTERVHASLRRGNQPSDIDIHDVFERELEDQIRR